MEILLMKYLWMKKSEKHREFLQKIFHDKSKDYIIKTEYKFENKNLDYKKNLDVAIFKRFGK